MFCPSSTAEAADCSSGSALSHFLSWKAELLPAPSAELPHGGAKTNQPLQFVIFQAHKMVQTPPRLFARYTRLGTTALLCCCPAPPTQRPCSSQLFWVTSEIRQNNYMKRSPFMSDCRAWSATVLPPRLGSTHQISKCTPCLQKPNCITLSSSWRQIPDFHLF